MKFPKAIFTSFMAAATVFGSACSTMVAGGASVSHEIEPTVYRGSVSETREDGSIEVTQQPGYDYGQASIVFFIDENTMMDLENGAPNQDAFVEVVYSGALTRSLPPQATANEITVIANFSEGILQNGTVQAVQQTGSGYTIELLPFGAEDGGPQSVVVLNVPSGALENLAPEDLVAGAEVSAVTRGIAAMSMPPQMPVVVLTPYSG